MAGVGATLEGLFIPLILVEVAEALFDAFSNPTKSNY